ncbi:TRP-domain-containing protein [Lepidopterella palustris CBS 459.81]|uniref:TRP-domain-containing protein n=1 Tax=Lepidopterella palustris CBS 459.81 TaxID=1314670 RepID=A0A8E2EJW6_9PEZI|nr:TRP-domain-containing protein [Lepidopterella palustris CBS 459.81]
MAFSFYSRSPFVLAVALLSLFRISLAAQDIQYVQTTDAQGNTIYLRDNRRPALYTQNFGDCLGSSDVNVTRFDAAYYKDNMTVLFHLAGNTAIKNESLMMYIGVYAYGESRFDLTFNPCNANINSLCPMRAGIPIEANGIIPISQSDVAGIPNIALSIPDFEGEAILRIFANSTESEIGCFSAVITNGATFSQPESVGSILGIFTVVAIIASFATAIYGDNIPIMRRHYAHSLSVLVVFAVFQHIFFTGALSMNWPSVLVAFWSNFAWAGGMIYSEPMQNSINKFIGSNKGNTSAVGAAAAGTSNEGLGGGYDIHQIYKRALNIPGLMRRSKFNRVARSLEQALAKRDLVNNTDGFDWYGQPVKPGLPLPGNFSGFAGTLGQESIPASNAFMTGFLWFLILLVVVGASVISLKWLLEGLSRVKLIKNDRLLFFRAHWLGYTAFALLRSMFIGFFMIVFLCLFQFTYKGATGVIAVAAIVFFLMFVSMFALAGYACFYRIKFGNYVTEPDRLNLERKRVLKAIPWYRFTRASKHLNEEKIYAGSIPWWRVSPASPESTKSIHEDEDYTKKFGWLASRFRRTRWWFFAVWLFYEFIRACFYAGASGHPMTQVFGLLVVEFIAFIAIIIMRPFEGQRLNAIVVYLLGFSKVATLALSAAFDVRFNLPRIPTTVIGIVIIVIQAILTIVLLIAIAIGAISSYMSVMRNREEFKPKRWIPLREKYFKHIDQAEKDVPAPPPPPPPAPEEPKEPYFSVNSIRRVPKIEDEDREFIAEIGRDVNASQISLGTIGKHDASSSAEVPTRASRAGSIRSQMSYTSLPYGARIHRASWSSRDFNDHFAHERRRTASSTAPLVPDPDSRRTSQNIGINTRFTSSRESVTQRGPIPLAAGVPSRPRTPTDVDRVPSPLARPRSRNPTTSPSSPYRPPLRTLISENEVPPLEEYTAPGRAI